MNNRHLLKVVNHYPQKQKQNLDQGFRLSLSKGDSASSSVVSIFMNNRISSSIEDLSNNEALNRIESNISSWIPS